MKHHEALAAGILSGIAAGLAMMAVAMIASAGQHVSPLLPLQAIGESFVGPEALEGVPEAAFGLLVHLLVSVILGILFAAIVPRDFGTTCAMGLGVGLTLFAMGFMMSTFVPWVNPGFRGHLQVIGGSWVLAHAVFGVTVGLVPTLRRRIAREASQPASAPATFAPRGAEVASSRTR
jgi:hypothetical protein